MTELKKYFAVIGNPIHHSLSPQIHAAFAKEAGIDIHYEAVLSPLDQFQDTVKTLISRKLTGANVTLPFKKEAYALATTHTDYAKIAEAVNTLEFKEDQIIGHNTDGLGLVRDLEQNLQFNLKGKKILLIGAGGAAEGVIYSILEKEPSQLTLTNRTIEKSNIIHNKMNVFLGKPEISIYAALDHYHASLLPKPVVRQIERQSWRDILYVGLLLMILVFLYVYSSK